MRPIRFIDGCRDGDISGGPGTGAMRGVPQYEVLTAKGNCLSIFGHIVFDINPFKAIPAIECIQYIRVPAADLHIIVACLVPPGRHHLEKPLRLTIQLQPDHGIGSRLVSPVRGWGDGEFLVCQPEGVFSIDKRLQGAQSIYEPILHV